MTLPKLDEFETYMRSFCRFEHVIFCRGKIQEDNTYLMHELNVKLSLLRAHIEILNKKDNLYYYALYDVCFMFNRLGNTPWIKQVLPDIPKRDFEIINSTCGMCNTLYEAGIVDKPFDEKDFIESDKELKDYEKWSKIAGQ